MLMIILNKPTALVVPAALGVWGFLSFSYVDGIVKRPDYLGYKLIRDSDLLYLQQCV